MLKMLWLSLVFVICALAATTGVAHREGAKPDYLSIESEAPPAQDVMILDRRISSLEQRIYSLESSINQLQQQITLSRTQAAPPAARDPGIDRLLSEIQLLQQRIREVECAVVKLDERTLPPAARDSRRAPAQGGDPCRLQPQTPVQLSARPR